MDLIRDIVLRHKAGEPVGVTSVCSAHPLVIEATFRHALRTRQPIVLIEATSNQVNQDGGYTGMVPADFRSFVEAISTKAGFPLDRLVLGGDHLGPNAWTALPAAQAMDKAEIMVADYVRAGFGKIHLDCSMSCADDPVPLPERTIAERAARLCRAAEDAFTGDAADAPVYVIGTEVPVPGGAAEDLDELALTTPDAAIATVDMHRALFGDLGLADAWERVIATVVQPGVEFDHDKVVDYRPERAVALSRAIEPVNHLVFEAHSTDYQTAEALAALVRDHFAILKVGPGVTFALREALWALDAIEAETVAPGNRANLREVTLERMRAEPKNWAKYYHASGEALTQQLQYSLSDRVRYYWPDPEIAAAQEWLFANLRDTPPSLPLISQYLPLAYAALRSGQANLDPAELVIAHVGATLDAYHGACYPHA
ncbi:D-tagatose-bisphosphate aldolase, class II, non-catalytic subunit [Sphingomonas gei]|uniref:D-tagatose-bisphosphate aldolase, class II, non-catalytic subunit n=1 Tax=Sphingomonas gei TaxID=1395960 RepID=A0A4S1X985_9SPHN|nr:D-tagatose-bisphosphate aldolase, class II, non-catalytic subunit [Sphingomonas gei]TGX52558.1 D-tagatose-bisphosphate aldolase, class II, non-catalytic subunit [Sphingomonas gei]